MKQCTGRATLLITRNVKDTSTTIARERIKLACQLMAGHLGPHHDPEKDERWDASPDAPTTLLRQEDTDD
jgi:hypothetical protein